MASFPACKIDPHSHCVGVLLPASRVAALLPVGHDLQLSQRYGYLGRRQEPEWQAGQQVDLQIWSSGVQWADSITSLFQLTLAHPFNQALQQLFLVDRDGGAVGEVLLAWNGQTVGPRFQCAYAKQIDLTWPRRELPSARLAARWSLR